MDIRIHFGLNLDLDLKMSLITLYNMLFGSCDTGRCVTAPILDIQFKLSTSMQEADRVGTLASSTVIVYRKHIVGKHCWFMNSRLFTVDCSGHSTDEVHHCHP